MRTASWRSIVDVANTACDRLKELQEEATSRAQYGLVNVPEGEVNETRENDTDEDAIDPVRECRACMKGD